MEVAVDVEQLLKKAEADTRTPDELFESMKRKIQAAAQEKMTEKEAIAATRNFIGFCEAIMGLGPTKRSNLDKEENR